MSTRQRNIRMMGWWVIVIVGVVLAVNLTKSMVEFLKLKGRLVEAQNQLIKLKTEQKILDEEYRVKTQPEYLEKQVRDRLNMAKPGEMVVVIPESELKEASGAAHQALESQPRETEQPIWKKWWESFLIDFY